MNYDDFMSTLNSMLGLADECGHAPIVDAVSVQIKCLDSLQSAVDDLLAEAGYDTMFDTREKCLEALRDVIKAKLRGRPTTETLALALSNAMTSTFLATGKWGEVRKVGVEELRLLASATLMFLDGDDDYIASGRLTPVAKVVDQEGLAKLLYNPHGYAVVAWEHKSEAARSHFRDMAAAALKYIGATSTANETRARNLLSDEVLRLRTELADAQRQVGVWRDTAETQKKMRLDLAAEQDKLVAALDEAQNQLAAERKKWPELKAEVERLKKLNAQIDIARDQYLRDLLSERRKNADLRTTNKDLMERPAHKPLDRDRIRLALLDFSPTVNFINDLADHLVKRLA